MTGIIDYGVGNLFSLCSSFAYIGEKAIVSNDEKVLSLCDRIILPGVGAFSDAVKKLCASGLDKFTHFCATSNKPLLGICLGMQLLFDKSYEYGEHEGLGLIKGEVVPIKPDVPSDLKIPQMGWNSLVFPENKEKSPLFKYINDGDYVYFVHSYYAKNCEKSVIASTEYGAILTAAVSEGTVFGTQFHPEKSGEVGLSILRAFCEM